MCYKNEIILPFDVVLSCSWFCVHKCLLVEPTWAAVYYCFCWWIGDCIEL